MKVVAIIEFDSELHPQDLHQIAHISSTLSAEKIVIIGGQEAQIIIDAARKKFLEST